MNQQTHPSANPN